MTSAERVSIGFSGGQVVEVRIDDGKLKDLRKALEKGDGWLDLDAEEGMVSIDLSQVVFIRSATTPQKSASAASDSPAQAREARAPRAAPRRRAPLAARRGVRASGSGPASSGSLARAGGEREAAPGVRRPPWASPASS